jgi:hypothetical protein
LKGAFSGVAILSQRHHNSSRSRSRQPWGDCLQGEANPQKCGNLLVETQHVFNKQVRQYCKNNGILYQAFGLYSAENAVLLEEEVVHKFTRRLDIGKQAAILAVVLAAAQLDGERFCVLDGSRDRTHLEENWKAYVELASIPEDDLRSFPTVLGIKRVS